MAASQGVLRIHQQEQTLLFQMAGWGTMHHSLPMRQLSAQALAAGTTSLRVDLRHCTYMDSTFLGTLLFLKRIVDRCGAGQFALISPSIECRQLLQKMALEDYYPTVLTDELPANAWTELSCEPGEAGCFKQNVVQAHQELANLGGRAGAPFRAAAERLTRELEAEQAQKKASAPQQS